jgi:hypothetical protein
MRVVTATYGWEGHKGEGKVVYHLSPNDVLEPICKTTQESSTTTIEPSIIPLRVFEDLDEDVRCSTCLEVRVNYEEAKKVWEDPEA